MKWIALAMMILSGAVSIDRYAALKADEVLLSHDAYFESRLDGASLAIEGPRRQECQIGMVFLLYRYQTCFILEINNGAASGPGFDYIYHRPLPLLYFPDGSADSYYFREPSLGLRLKTLTLNKVVVYSILKLR